MRWITFLRQSPDVLIALSLGAVALLLSQFDDLTVLRWIVGFSFVFLTSGYAATRLLPQHASTTERIIASSLVSLLLTYPAAVITVIAEGQSPQTIFGRHLTQSLSSLYILSVGLTIWISRRITTLPKFGKYPKIMVIPLTIYTLLTFANLNRADVFGDEYDLGYQAYDLVDGIVAGRKGFLVSMSQHPPLAITIKHFMMNILEPRGLDRLSDWQFRLSEGIVGLHLIAASYALAVDNFSKKAGIITAGILSVNNYIVWMGRTFHREIYLTFFMTAAMFFYIKAKKKRTGIYQNLAGLSFGAALLVKETALVMLAIPAYDILREEQTRRIAKKVLLLALMLFLPVVIYNLIVYTTTGYADVFFSNLFGIPHPLTTPLEATPLLNTVSMVSYLADIYSPALFGIFLVSFFAAVRDLRRSLPFVLWLVAGSLLFAITAVRAYYFLFFTIPFAILAASWISKFKKALAIPLMLLIFGYSLRYSVMTNLSRSYSRAETIGGIDGSVILPLSLTQPYSLAARSWVEEVGYKRLQERLDAVIGENDCLTVSDSFDSLAARRYLLRDDGIKEYYLGLDYPTRYPRCPEDPQNLLGTMYRISDAESEPGRLLEVVTDHLGNSRFFLFVQETRIKV